MTGVPYVTVDVFTRRRFTGNPLAVVTDARGLDDAQMQRIAAEFNYSETTFVLPPADPQSTARVRIFTPTDEIPFAGHPNVGTAFVLGQAGAALGRPVGDAMRFEEGAGAVRVALLREDGTVCGARIEAPRPLALGPAVDPQAVAGCASLPLADLRLDELPPVIASVGLPFALAEVSGLAALARATPDAAAFAAADRRYPHADDRFALFLFARLSATHARARMFAPLSATPEDPATGSACAAFGARLLALRPEPDLALDLVIEQGVEMGRASTISSGCARPPARRFRCSSAATACR